jgi:hypothetical protein
MTGTEIALARTPLSSTSSTSNNQDNNYNPFDTKKGKGRRSDGTNPRALGTNPKALGTNPRALGTNPKKIGIIVPQDWRPSQSAWTFATKLGFGERELAQFIRYNRHKRYHAFKWQWNKIFVGWCKKIHQRKEERSAQPTETPMGQFGGSLLDGRKLGMWETVW